MWKTGSVENKTHIYNRNTSFAMTVVMLLTRTVPENKGGAATAKKICASSGQCRAIGEGSMEAARWQWEHTYPGPASGPLCGRKQKDAWETPISVDHFIYYSFSERAKGWQTTCNGLPGCIPQPQDTKPAPAPLTSCCLLCFPYC